MNDRTDPSRHPSFGRREAPVRRLPTRATAPAALVISCDDCAMQCTSACADCVVSFVLQHDAAEPLVLDEPEERAVRLLAKAGLLPDLQFQHAG